MEMIFGDECELEYVLGLIRDQDRDESSLEPMPTARYLADRLRAGLVTDGVDEDQIATTSDIVNWFLVYEAPQGSWHRAYAQCLATLMIYFFGSSGPLDSPGDRLTRESDFLRLETECGYVLMADRLRMATEEVSQQLERTRLWFENTNDALIDVSQQLDAVKQQAGTAPAASNIEEKLNQILVGMGEIKGSVDEAGKGIANLQPKESGKHKALRLQAERKKEEAAHRLSGAKFVVAGFHKRWAEKEGCSPENIKRLLQMARDEEGSSEKGTRGGGDSTPKWWPRVVSKGRGDT
jgi:hypothetical protein